jgi:PH domain
MAALPTLANMRSTLSEVEVAQAHLSAAVLLNEQDRAVRIAADHSMWSHDITGDAVSEDGLEPDDTFYESLSNGQPYSSILGLMKVMKDQDRATTAHHNRRHSESEGDVDSIHTEGEEEQEEQHGVIASSLLAAPQPANVVFSSNSLEGITRRLQVAGLFRPRPQLQGLTAAGTGGGGGFRAAMKGSGGGAAGIAGSSTGSAGASSSQAGLSGLGAPVCCVGREVVDYLLSMRQCSDRDEAVMIGRALVVCGFLASFPPQQYQTTTMTVTADPSNSGTNAAASTVTIYPDYFQDSQNAHYTLSMRPHPEGKGGFLIASNAPAVGAAFAAAAAAAVSSSSSSTGGAGKTGMTMAPAGSAPSSSSRLARSAKNAAAAATASSAGIANQPSSLADHHRFGSMDGGYSSPSEGGGGGGPSSLASSFGGGIGGATGGGGGGFLAASMSGLANFLSPRKSFFFGSSGGGAGGTGGQSMGTGGSNALLERGMSIGGVGSSGSEETPSALASAALQVKMQQQQQQKQQEIQQQQQQAQRKASSVAAPTAPTASAAATTVVRTSTEIQHPLALGGAATATSASASASSGTAAANFDDGEADDEEEDGEESADDCSSHAGRVVGRGGRGGARRSAIPLPPLEPFSIIKQSWLTKQGHRFKTWKKRWFILTGNGLLSYYRGGPPLATGGSGSGGPSGPFSAGDSYALSPAASLSATGAVASGQQQQQSQQAPAGVIDCKLYNVERVLSLKQAPVPGAAFRLVLAKKEVPNASTLASSAGLSEDYLMFADTLFEADAWISALDRVVKAARAAAFGGELSSSGGPGAVKK